MAWGAIAGALISAYASSRQSERAADAMEQGQRRGISAQRGMFNRALELNRPYRESGRRALTALESLAGLSDEDFDISQDPGYQFRMDQGQKAQERGAAARGGLLSGQHSKGLERFAQGLASQEYQNVFSRLSNIAGMGQQASGMGSQQAMAHGQQLGGMYSGIGQAQAAGHLGQGQAMQQFGNQASLLWGLQNQQNQQQNPGSQWTWMQQDALERSLNRGGG